MKIRRIPLLLAGAALFLITAAYAQNKGAKKVVQTKPVAPSKPVMEVTLGQSERVGGNISKREFDAMAPQGVRIKNPQGAFIEGFSFTYGERNMYEDSAGNPKPVTDYLTEYCMGDTLSPIISHTIAERTKPGDTAYYDDIHIRLPNGKPAIGRAMKFVITR
jgi:hypothetical protein